MELYIPALVGIFFYCAFMTIKAMQLAAAGLLAWQVSRLEEKKQDFFVRLAFERKKNKKQKRQQ